MKNIIKRYCENENIKNGLILLDMPTGSGKTHSVLDFIHDYVVNGGDKKIFFITTLLKNLPEEELKNRFEKSGHLSLFKEKFLRIESNADSVCHFFDSTDVDVVKHRNSIPKSILDADEFKQLKSDVEWINRNLASPKAEDRKYAVRIKTDMQQHSERDFRFYLERLLADTFKTADARKKAILTDDNLKWIADMYPAVKTKEKQILFLSINKFLVRNNTIIEPSYLFYNSDIIEKSFIFIDEFDATKETMLGTIIENGIRGKQDTLELFRDIYTALNSDVRTFPTALTIESDYNKKRREEGKLRKSDTPVRIITTFKEIAKKLFTEYRFDLSFKTDRVNDGVQRQFLFHDHRFHSISGGAAKIKKDDVEKLNYIQFGERTDETGDDNVSVMLGRVRGFLSYFQTGIKMLALNYQNYKNENKAPTDDVFSFEFAIKSILHEFHLKDRQIEYLTSSILDSSKKSNSISSPYDLSLYEKGFRLYDFKDDFEHDMQSIIMMENFQLTPEKIMLRICERAKVVGISATATLPSVVGNYDLDYLKRHLGSNFHNIDEEQRLALKRQFAEATAHYDRVHIEALPVCAEINGGYSISSWKQIAEDEEIAEELYNIVDRSTFGADKEYNSKRYLRIALAYNFFVTHEDIKSFLCVLTKYPQNNDYALKLNVIKNLCDKIEQLYDSTKRNRIELLSSDDFENEKVRISKRLSNGEKVFVISIYQAIGSGQNLQYTIPNELEFPLEQINEFEARAEKDYDAIYLDHPTNLLVPLINDLSEADFAKYLFQVEFLSERVEISSYVAIEHIRKAFQIWSNPNSKKKFVESILDTKSVRFLSTRMIIQAIGRICRTNMKNKNIYVLVDKEILAKIDKNYFKERLCNKEFEKLLELVADGRKEDNGNQLLISKNDKNAERANMYIRNLLRGEWTSEKIAQWEKLRNFVLKHPTIAKSTIGGNDHLDEANIVEYMYTQLPCKMSRIFYKQEGDYSDVDISFERDAIHCKEVSEQNARLDVLMTEPEIKKYFEVKGYATEFKPDSYILSPTLFNNIYKGALGEVVGCWTMKKKLGYSLDNITDENIYELFDFKLRDKPVYFDMKHWQETMLVDKDKMYEKIVSKLCKCGGRVAVIVNILSTEGVYSTIQSHEQDGVTVIEIPYLYGESDMQLNYEALHSLKGVIDGLSD